MALGDLALAAGLALGEAAFFGLFFGAALGLAGDFLGAGFLAGDFLATVFFRAGDLAFDLAGDLAFEAGFAGDFLAAFGDLRAARLMRTHSRRHVGRSLRAWPSRRAWRPSATSRRAWRPLATSRPAWGSSWASPSSARACGVVRLRE